MGVRSFSLTCRRSGDIQCAFYTELQLIKDLEISSFFQLIIEVVKSTIEHVHTIGVQKLGIFF